MSAQPVPPEQIYKRTAQRLNLPEEYVKDVVEYYYAETKTQMHNLQYVIFYLHGLGRILIRPLKFWRRKERLKETLDSFATRRDDRGIMIRKELELRYSNMENLDPYVKEYNDYKGRHIKKYKDSLGK